MNDSVIVVLANGIAYDGTITEETRLRVCCGASLFGEGGYANIIMAGRWSYLYDYAPVATEAEVMKEYAAGLGVPRDRVLTDENSVDTIGNAYFTKKIVDGIGSVRRLVVVTTDYHVDRARYIFSTVYGNGFGLEVRGVNPGYGMDIRAEEEAAEARSLAFCKTLFDVGFRSGENADYIVRNFHPLYANDLEKVPREIKEAFLKRGITEEWLKNRSYRKELPKT